MREIVRAGVQTHMVMHDLSDLDAFLNCDTVIAHMFLFVTRSRRLQQSPHFRVCFGTRRLSGVFDRVFVSRVSFTDGRMVDEGLRCIDVSKESAL